MSIYKHSRFILSALAILVMLLTPAVALAQQGPAYCIQDQQSVGYTKCEVAVYHAIVSPIAQSNFNEDPENFLEDTANDVDWGIRQYNINQQLNGGPTVRELGLTSMSDRPISEHAALNNNYYYGEHGYVPPEEMAK